MRRGERTEDRGQWSVMRIGDRRERTTFRNFWVLGFELCLRRRLMKGRLIVDVYKFLLGKKEFVLSKQLLRSGTSIGAKLNACALKMH